jgi:uncharacterized membrane protein
MEMNRVESFSDGVIAVIITIMVLELKAPADGSLAALEKALPQFLAYVLSFLTVATMWSNHHNLLKGARTANSWLMWANNNLLFWMSLAPFATAYLAAHPFEPIPAALYGVTFTMMGFGFAILRNTILRQRHGHRHEVPRFEWRMQLKDIASGLAYLTAIGFAFVNQWVSYAIYVAIPVMYFLPDVSLVEPPAKKPNKY